KNSNWGFSDMNRRDPEIELLEYLTREQPNSPWFDDVSTPEHETRDVILVRSFAQAIASLRKEFGEDMERWRWKNINRLQIASLYILAKFLPKRGDCLGE